MKRHLHLSTMVLVGVLSGTVFAAGSDTSGVGTKDGTQSTAPSSQSSKGDQSASNMFKQLDTNKDGFVSQSEAARSADLQARFAELDRNTDNKISFSEYQGGEKNPVR